MKNIIFILCLSFLFSIHYVAYCNSHKQDIVLTPNRIISKVQELTKPNAKTGNDERIIELLNYALKEEYRFKKTQKDFFRKLILEKITNDSVSQDSKIDYLRIFERFPLALKYDDKIVNNHLWITSRDSRSVKKAIFDLIYFSGLYTTEYMESLVSFLESHAWSKEDSNDMFFVISYIIVIPPYTGNQLKDISESLKGQEQTSAKIIEIFLDKHFIESDYNGAKYIIELLEKNPELYISSLYAPKYWNSYLNLLGSDDMPNDKYEQILAKTINDRAKVIFEQKKESFNILLLEYFYSTDDQHHELDYFDKDNLNMLQHYTKSKNKKLANLAKKCIETRKDLVANCKD